MEDVRKKLIGRALASYEDSYDDKNLYHLAKRYEDMLDEGDFDKALKMRARYKSIEDLLDKGRNELRDYRDREK